MNPPDWGTLLGAVVDGRFRLRTLTCAGRNQAEYKAEQISPKCGPVNLTLIAAPPEEMDQLRTELLQAAGLRCPFLLRILETGQCAVAGEELLYLASESPDETLADRLQDGPLPEREARDLLLDVISGLQFLHARGLVCRSVEPYAIVRVGSCWKLADFGRMRPAGATEPLAALDGSRYIPPEAYEGMLLEASDVWSLGALMTEALTGTTDPFMLSKPFDGIRERCFEKNPRNRPTLEEIAALLGRRSAPVQPDCSAETGETNPPEPDPRDPDPSARAGFPKSAKWLAPALVGLSAAAMWVWRTGEPQRTAPAPAAARAPAVRSVPAPKPPEPARRESRTAPAPVTGRADFTAGDMNGRRTASGERFDNRRLTAAHPTYPLGTRLRVTNLKNGRSVIVTVNDRATFRKGYIIRLTRRAASQLDFRRFGSAPVRAEVVN